MRESFRGAVQFTIRHEGGDKIVVDAGGMTKFGIAKRYNPDLDIQNLTEEEAEQIYLERYWIPNGCDDLPFPMDVLHFDACVNPGPGAARSWRFTAKNSSHYMMLRIQYYRGRVKAEPAKKEFFWGWINRCVDLWEIYVV